MKHEIAFGHHSAAGLKVICVGITAVFPATVAFGCGTFVPCRGALFIGAKENSHFATGSLKRSWTPAEEVCFEAVIYSVAGIAVSAAGRCRLEGHTFKLGQTVT